MLIAGYYDASKTADDGQPILAVAGFVSSNIQWHYDFCGPWQRVLKQQGLEYFHMTDYETRQPPYADWDEDRRKRVLTELLAIIGRSVVFGAGAAVFLNDYNALSEGADIFAYETAKQTLRVAGRGSRTNLRKSAEILLNSRIGYRVEYCDAASLARLIPMLRTHGATKAGVAPGSSGKAHG